MSLVIICYPWLNSYKYCFIAMEPNQHRSARAVCDESHVVISRRQLARDLARYRS